jgi:zinc-ribbon domain
MRFCPNCGTEVDETALFCPTCGQAIDQAAETAMPAAPAWPEPPAFEKAAPEEQSVVEPPAPAPNWQSTAPPADAWDVPEPWEANERPEAVAEPAVAPHPAAPPSAGPPPPPPQPAAPPPPAAPEEGAPSAPGSPVSSVPLTLPVTLSGWLIGVGALVGALGALISVIDGSGSLVGVVVLVALLFIAGSVFLATALPAIPHLRLVTLAIALIGFGAAFDRIGFAGAGIGALLLFLGTAAAAIGAILLELGRDEPLGRG